MYGIPNPHLDKKVVERRIDLLREEGIEFVTKTDIGGAYPAKKLLKDFNAAVLCCGATKPRDLAIDGRKLKGIHFAMEFLTLNTKSLLDSNHRDGKFISAKDKAVIVIGGGDTGTDCVATSMRHGCRSLVQFEILPRPPDDRAPDNPWPQWPKIYRLDYGQEEAKALFGHDPRTYQVMTKRFIGSPDGSIRQLETVQAEWVKESGRMVPKEISGTEKKWDADLVLLAMGFLGPEKAPIAGLSLAQDERGNVKAEYEKYETSVKGIFSAGDMRRGQSLVVWAINEGRGAARECDRYLMGSTSLP